MQSNHVYAFEQDWFHVRLKFTTASHFYLESFFYFKVESQVCSLCLSCVHVYFFKYVCGSTPERNDVTRPGSKVARVNYLHECATITLFDLFTCR